MELRDELERYLSTDPENVTNVIAWWHEHRAMYPCLSRMALDYLTIPGRCYSQYDYSDTHDSCSSYFC
jgi:hypothetical protein